jgi:hypothetical protein
LPLPNFILVGAGKAGTTSLYSYLAQHPQIYMSPTKDPRYFSSEYYTTFNRNAIGHQYREEGMSIEEYEALFSGVTDEIAVGEASTEYLFFEKTAERIKNTIPDAKIIIILRDPVERAFSAYCYHVRDGRETLSFEESLEREPSRENEKWQVGWFYKRGGLYYKQVKRYLEMFDWSRVKLILWEDLNQSPQKVYTDIFDFLQVNTAFVPNLSRANQSLTPRSQFINRHVFKNCRFKRQIQSILPEALHTRISRPPKKMFYNDSKNI